jgi:SAM-dependent methyltransferase
MEHVPEDVFDEDYLYFYETFLTDEVSDRQADLLWQLLGLKAGMDVLDLACGHGRIANRLAARGVGVTGLDRSRLFLERARRDAGELDVDYVEGDMRELPWKERFDAVAIWFTSFGYFDDEGNQRVAAEARKALKPGGRLAIDIHNRDAFGRGFLPATMVERDGDLMVDRHEFDVLTGRNDSERFIIRDGHVRRTAYSVRFYTYTEIRDLLVDVGFVSVEAFDQEGKELSYESRRMIVLATR